MMYQYSIFHLFIAWLTCRKVTLVPLVAKLGHPNVSFKKKKKKVPVNRTIHHHVYQNQTRISSSHCHIHPTQSGKCVQSRITHWTMKVESNICNKFVLQTDHLSWFIWDYKPFDSQTYLTCSSSSLSTWSLPINLLQFILQKSKNPFWLE